MISGLVWVALMALPDVANKTIAARMQKLFNTTVFLAMFLGGGGVPNWQAAIPLIPNHQPQVHSGTTAQGQYGESAIAASLTKTRPANAAARVSCCRFSAGA